MIAKPGALLVPGTPLRVMTCHETEDAHCLSWLHYQLGRGNNIALRLRMAVQDDGRDMQQRDLQEMWIAADAPFGAP